jgi:hypothetical protein
MTAVQLHPRNDLAFVVTVRRANSAGRLVPLEQATDPVAFLATSSGSEATAADPTLSVTPTPTGSAGKWLVVFQSDTLTAQALEDAGFAEGTPLYCVVQFDEGVRVAVELALVDTKLVVAT